MADLSTWDQGFDEGFAAGKAFDDGFAAGLEHARTGKRKPRAKMSKAEKVERTQEGQRRRHARLLADPTAEPHGVYTTYVNAGCSCDDCKLAWRDYCRAYRARRATQREATS